jgi:two-component system chemotaxis response regulator CheY
MKHTNVADELPKWVWPPVSFSGVRPLRTSAKQTSNRQVDSSSDFGRRACCPGVFFKLVGVRRVWGGRFAATSLLLHFMIRRPMTTHLKPPSQLKALVVEDDFTSRLMLQTFLSRYGECHIAINGREAVRAFSMELAAGAPYHVVCMDIVMPEMNGIEAVRLVREMELAQGVPPGSGKRIIMTSGIKDVQQVFQSYDETCDAYLFKPIDTAKLLKELQAFGLLK